MLLEEASNRLAICIEQFAGAMRNFRPEPVIRDGVLPVVKVENLTARWPQTVIEEEGPLPVG